MYKKINFYMRFIALFSMTLSSIILFAVCFGMFNSRLNAEINSEIGIIANALNNSPDYSAVLHDMEPSLGGKQLLLVSSEGEILYNLNLQEKTAEKILKGNTADASAGKYRFSDNLGSLMYSRTITLDNGNILYILSPAHNTLKTILTFAAPIAALILLIYLVSVLISRRLTENIIEPFEKSYSFNRENYDDVYDELRPFLKRIAQQNKEIRGNMEELKRAEKIRREFSANVSHELKTPLTSIKGYSQIISNGIAKEEDIPKFAEKIEKESSRLIILIDDIINLSKLDENELELQKGVIDLKTAVEHVYERLLPVAQMNGIHLEINAETADVYANPNQIDELIFNLVDNAIKYNRENGRVIITVGKTAEKKRFVSVEDTGIGIPEKYLDRIFERFFRVDKSHSKLINGTGLGLSIVKHIAISSDADISVQSEEGKGSKFTAVFN